MQSARRHDGGCSIAEAGSLCIQAESVLSIAVYQASKLRWLYVGQAGVCKETGLEKRGTFARNIRN